MAKILFQELTALMREHGKVKEAYFEIEESEIRRNDWVKNPGGYSRLSNSEYHVAFFSSLKNDDVYIEIDEISGQTEFSSKIYAQNTIFGKVARKILAENNLNFLRGRGEFKVGKEYMELCKPKRIQNTSELKTTLEKLIKTQSRIIKLEKGFEELLYELSKD